MARNINVLIIDDKPSNIFVLEQVLENTATNFLSATNGEEGLRLALTKNVDLIILDVQMPGMDGFEVANILKSNKKTKDIPIVFTSAESKERETIMKAFQQGAVEFLLKPLDTELAKAKVNGLLAIQIHRRELLEKNTALELAEREIRKLNEDLEGKVRELEIMNKDLESFSYSVSHDLRAPVRSIAGYTEIVKEEVPDEHANAHQFLDRIMHNATKMNNMIDDLLRFARLGKGQLNMMPLDMHKLVEGIVRELRTQHSDNAVIHLAPLLPANGDTSLITHVWTNLISNALKYSSKKQSPLVEISCANADDEVVYTVKDNGVGFKMEYANKLFGVFQRLHKSEEFEGTGIGLAIVQRIIHRHGGRIWAEAEPEKGATFSFSLPKA